MRILRVPSILASATLAATLLSAQGTGAKPGGTTGAPTGSAPTTGTGNNPSTPGLPGRGTIPGNNNPTNNPSVGPDAISRGTFFYGKVAMADGTTLPTNVVIE